MKICLINPVGIKYDSLAFPHGILHLCAELKRKGHECLILDCNLRPPRYAELKNFDLIGLSVMSAQLKHAAEIAGNIPEGANVVWGGVHCLLDPLSIVNSFKNHFVISGDGEHPLPSLIQYLEGKHDKEWLRNQEGICFFDGAPVINKPYFMKDVNETADVDYHDLPELERYTSTGIYYFKEKLPHLSVLAARGCCWDCSFCINSIFRKHKALHRTKSFEKIRRESEKIIDEFKCRVVFPADDDFFANQDLVNQWKDYAVEKNFLWSATSRFNYFKDANVGEERLRELVDGGLFCLGMAIEAGTEEIRNKIINKRIKDADITQAVKTIKKAVGDRLAVNTSFVVFFPGDTHRNRLDIIKWMNYTSNEINMFFSGPQVYRPYPGSKLYDAEKNHVYGDMNYYLKNIDATGEFKIVGRANRLARQFFSTVIRNHFNRGNMFFKTTTLAGGRIGWEVIETPKENAGALRGRVYNSLERALFATFQLRLRSNYWRFFFEPAAVTLGLAALKRAANTYLYLRGVLRGRFA